MSVMSAAGFASGSRPEWRYEDYFRLDQTEEPGGSGPGGRGLARPGESGPAAEGGSSVRSWPPARGPRARRPPRGSGVAGVTGVRSKS